MKTRNVLIAFGATALAVITLNINASGALLSPRAASNEIIHVSGTNSDPNLIALGLTSAEYASPREAGNKAMVIAGTNKEVNPATLCNRYMTASPKVIQACAANPSGPMPCCVVATTK